MTSRDTDTITESAIESWLWSSIVRDISGENDNGEEVDDVPADDWLRSKDAEVDAETRTKWASDVERFMDQADPIFDQMEEVGINIKDIGHDIALTRGGHGTGFWDRGYPEEFGEVLSDLARSLGDMYAYSYVKDGKFFIGSE